MIEGKESLFFLHIVTHLLGSGTNSSPSPLTQHLGEGEVSHSAPTMSLTPPLCSLMPEGVLKATETLFCWPPEQQERA